MNRRHRHGHRRRVGILASGRGSNMAALIAAAADPDYPAEVALVLCNVPGAGALQAARAAGLTALCIDHREYGRDRAAHEAAMHRELHRHAIQTVCLAGYMRLLTPFLVGRWAGQMLNIHPSLLPAFPGLHTHARALAAGVALHGCTVHLVTEVMDDGPILAQAAVPVLPGDNADSLAARVLVQEHRLYPAALAAHLGDVGQRPDASAALLNPLPAAAGRP
jgi:formyltetrahydrofolate-dependent phosphoribosylglycinamide formyltransferase